jgi:polar amino acid transport system substrate-binding protein
MRKLWMLVFSLVAAFSLSSHAQKVLPSMINGWYYWAPYQFMDGPQGLAQLTGLDIELVTQITKLTGREVIYEPVPWRQHQLDLKAGTRHFAAGATYTEERAQYVHYSMPYRYEENSLFTSQQNALLLKFNSIDAFLTEVRDKDFRLAVIDGFIYADPKINAFIDDPENASLVFLTKDDSESMKLFLNGNVQGFLADRTVGANIVWQTKTSDRVTEVPLNASTPIHFIFSKQSVPLQVVEDFNAAITEHLRSSGYRNTVTKYLAPVMFLKTIGSRWFRIVEMIGTIAFALSGVIIAKQQRSTLLAGFVFAFLPSFGGGMIRDVVFGIAPVYVLGAPASFVTVLGVVLLSFLLYRVAGDQLGHFFDYLLPKGLRNRPENFYLVVTDALGLAAFTVSGVFVTLVAQVEPFWLWAPFFAFLTGAGGGILRDVVARRQTIVAFSGTPYGEWAIIWGLLFSLYLYMNATNISQGIVSQGVVWTMLGVFSCRIFSFFMLKSRETVCE